jgi:hypothetical protein
LAPRLQASRAKAAATWLADAARLLLFYCAIVADAFLLKVGRPVQVPKGAAGSQCVFSAAVHHDRSVIGG